MNFSNLDITCNTGGWSVVQAIPPPTPPPSGWYIIQNTIKPTFYFSSCYTDTSVPVVGNILSGYINSGSWPAQKLWYYDVSNSSLSSLSYKASVTSSCVPGENISMSNAKYKRGDKIIPAKNVYLPTCGLFTDASNSISGNISPLFLTAFPSTTWNVTKQSEPTLSVKGNLNTGNWYIFTLRNKKVIWIDSNNNIITTTQSPEKRWFYDKDYSLYTYVNGIQMYWPKITPSNPGNINDDWTLLPLKLTTQTNAGTFNLLKPDTTGWSFIPNNINENSIFINTDVNTYVVFNWLTSNNESTRSMFPSQYSIFDLLSTVNVIQVNPPDPTSILTGYYYLQTDGLCLQTNGTWGNCNWSNAWYYDSDEQKISTVQGELCLSNTLDENCQGNANLIIQPCTDNNTKLIIGANGNIYDPNCKICYDPKNTTSEELEREQNNYNYTTYALKSSVSIPKSKSTSESTLKIIIFISLLIVIFLLFIRFIEKKIKNR